MEEVFSAISNYGFPIVVAVYLLMRFESKLDKLNESIEGKDGLTSMIEKQNMNIVTLCKKIEDLQHGRNN